MSQILSGSESDSQNLYEIVGRPSSIEEIKNDFNSFISELETQDIPKLSVYFGYAWDRDMDQDYLTLSPSELRSKIVEFEMHDIGEIGHDDLYIKLQHLKCERLYCHEADIHLTSETLSPYFLAEKKRWIDLGWQVYENHTSK